MIGSETYGAKWRHLALSEVAVLGRPASGPGDATRAKGACAKAWWPLVQRQLIAGCGDSFCAPDHYDAVLLCRDPRTGRAIAPTKIERADDRISLELDGGASMRFELRREAGGAWELEELMLGHGDVE